MSYPYNQPYIPTDDRIIVERHYIPPNLYRELYFGYPSQPQIYYHPASLQHTYYQPVYQPPQPPTNIAPNIYSPPTTINSNHAVHHPVELGQLFAQHQGSIPTIHNTRNLPSELFPRPANQTTQVPNRRNRLAESILNEAPVEIRNLINGLLNTRTPFEVQVSAVPAEIIMNRVAGNDDNNQPLSLSNINIVSTVSRFDSLETNIDTCSICQQSLNNIDIVRKLNNCTHIFHLSCIDTWLSERNTCPSCRHSLLNDLNNQQSNTVGNIASNTTRTTVNIVNDHDEDNEDDEDDEDDDENNEDEYDDEVDDDYQPCQCCHSTDGNSIITDDDDDDDDEDDESVIQQTSNTSNISMPTQTNNTIPININVNRQNNSNANPNIRIFNNLSQGLGDLINSGTPIITSLINGNSSNISPILNNISPLISAFTELMNNSNSSSFVYRNF